MTHQTTVLVIGGGGTGVGTARDLAMRGVDVTLVERSGLAGGTTGRSHGLLHSGARYAESDPEGAAECIEENQIIREIAGECIGDSGGIFVQLSEDDPEYFEAKLEGCQEHGIPAEVIDGDEARDRVPELSEDVVRAMVVPDGVIYPSRLVAANAASAENHGATVLTHAPVEGITVSDGAVSSVEIGGEVNETIEADYVINATGAWAGECAALAGVDVEMQPTKGVMVSVDYEGLEPVINRCRVPDDGDIIIPHQTQVVLGTTSVAVDDPDEFDEEQWEVQKMFEECADMMPAIEGRDIDRTWWGVRPLYAPDEAGRGSKDSGKGNERGISRGFFLLDHEQDGVENFASVVGGKLTTYRMMAEATADHVADVLGVEGESTTATEQLPGADDPEELDSLVAKYRARQPTDQDVISDLGEQAADD
ncbi:FAD-dependent oxidoreductase [Halohasta litchfieldiae]|jgi:glycerol-3-phosphate dehydrogenase|uniref:Glycerol-3-phosphate dehydrogenase n=1 Tax=Halohasta litchfieldiae TaxID=1073996 RepID=A0A1H6VGE5_9EURY|nr:FAD-dependent oxidoreductase [Halohasta litchfieldiae]SEJ02044.1 glycerol-3-phosphate dehydrogenase [Halohasta litchfieldiae]